MPDSASLEAKTIPEIKKAKKEADAAKGGPPKRKKTLKDLLKSAHKKIFEHKAEMNYITVTDVRKYKIDPQPKKNLSATLSPRNGKNLEDSRRRNSKKTQMQTYEDSGVFDPEVVSESVNKHFKQWMVGSRHEADRLLGDDEAYDHTEVKKDVRRRQTLARV